MAWTPPPATEADRAALAPRAGLCAACRHLQVVRSRTSAFVRCGRSDVRPEMPRYPPLPVLACPGYEPAEPVDTTPGVA